MGIRPCHWPIPPKCPHGPAVPYFGDRGPVFRAYRRGLKPAPSTGTRVSTRTRTQVLFTCRHFELTGHDQWLGLAHDVFPAQLDGGGDLRERRLKNTRTFSLGSGVCRSVGYPPWQRADGVHDRALCQRPTFCSFWRADQSTRELLTPNMARGRPLLRRPFHSAATHLGQLYRIASHHIDSGPSEGPPAPEGDGGRDAATQWHTCPIHPPCYRPLVCGQFHVRPVGCGFVRIHITWGVGYVLGASACRSHKCHKSLCRRLSCCFAPYLSGRPFFFVRAVRVLPLMYLRPCCTPCLNGPLFPGRKSASRAFSHYFVRSRVRSPIVRFSPRHSPMFVNFAFVRPFVQCSQRWQTTLTAATAAAGAGAPSTTAWDSHNQRGVPGMAGPPDMSTTEICNALPNIQRTDVRRRRQMVLSTPSRRPLAV